MENNLRDIIKQWNKLYTMDREFQYILNNHFENFPATISYLNLMCEKKENITELYKIILMIKTCYIMKTDNRTFDEIFNSLVDKINSTLRS